eukprot:6325824-Amphidinium_carterae.1
MSGISRGSSVPEVAAHSVLIRKMSNETTSERLRGTFYCGNSWLVSAGGSAQRYTISEKKDSTPPFPTPTPFLRKVQNLLKKLTKTHTHRWKVAAVVSVLVSLYQLILNLGGLAKGRYVLFLLGVSFRSPCGSPIHCSNQLEQESKAIPNSASA